MQNLGALLLIISFKGRVRFGELIAAWSFKLLYKHESVTSFVPLLGKITSWYLAFQWAIAAYYLCEVDELQLSREHLL